jgi:hypothetical protein
MMITWPDAAWSGTASDQGVAWPPAGRQQTGPRGGIHIQIPRDATASSGWPGRGVDQWCSPDVVDRGPEKSPTFSPRRGR